MHRAMTDEVHFGETVNSTENNRNEQSINYSNDFKDIETK